MMRNTKQNLSHFRFSILDFGFQFQNPQSPPSRFLREANPLLADKIQNSRGLYPLIHRWGGFTIEYLVLSAIVIAALITMAVYVERGLAGKWRSVGDSFGFGRQYEPGKTTCNGGPCP